MRSSLTTLLLLVVMTSFVASSPQQRPQQRRRRPAQARRQQQQASLQQQQPKFQFEDLPDGDLRKVTKNTRIEDITKERVDKLMRNEKSVNILVDCFRAPKACPSPQARQMIGQMNNIGAGGKGCKDCSPAKIKQRNEVIYYFLSQFRERHPKQYRRVIEQIPTILARITQ